MRGHYGYPGVKTLVLPNEGTVTQTVLPEDRPYLCVAHDTEVNLVQPLRLAASIVGGPLVVYAASQLPEDRPVLRAATALTGAAISAWSLWIWLKANEAIHAE